MRALLLMAATPTAVNTVCVHAAAAGGAPSVKPPSCVQGAGSGRTEMHK